jgi:hypothetical protein
MAVYFRFSKLRCPSWIDLTKVQPLRMRGLSDGSWKQPFTQAIGMVPALRGRICIAVDV